jgi:glutathione S-transferase
MVRLIQSRFMTITVHHLNLSRSLRALWLLEEVGLPYEIKQWQRDKDFRAPADAKAVHPLGRFPMVEVDGRVLAESGAILEYFAEREGKLRPEDQDAKIRYSFFLHYGEGSVMPPLLVQLLMDRVRTAPLPFFLKPIAKTLADKIDGAYTTPALELHLGFVESALGEYPYFAGPDFSMADIQMIYPVEAGLQRGGRNYPNMRAWRQRVTTRSAYQRAERLGGPAVPPSGT